MKKNYWHPLKEMNGRVFLIWIKKKKRYAQYAGNTLKKNRSITIRMNQNDLLGIQMKAAGEGIPYQTLITSIIHKYINGTFAVK